MIVFIGTVLILAAVQSFCKLALLPRRWELLTALLLGPLPYFFTKQLAGMSLRTWNAQLTNAVTLENWCALVVIQELFTLVIGFSLLCEREESADSGISSGGRAKHRWRWKCLCLFPSLLLPPGMLYAQMVFFNIFPEWNFTILTVGLSIGLPLTLLTVAEGLRFFRRKLTERILSVLHLEYFLLMSAIFLPVAARAKLMPAREEFAWRDPLLLIGAFLAACLAGALLCFGFQTLKRKRKYGNCHPNP